MFEGIKKFFQKNKKKDLLKSNSKDKAKERLHLVLMQDRANVSADFLDLMRREIIEVIKKYIDIDEAAMDVRLTTQTNEDGAQSAPALYANIPIINIKDETRKLSKTNQENKISIEPPKTNESKEEQKKEENIDAKNDAQQVEIKNENVDNVEDNVNEEQANIENSEEDNKENETENSNIQTENSTNETKENKENLEEEKKNEE